MKKMQILILLIASLFLSCSEQKNDSDNTQDKLENPIVGEWNLKKISGGFSKSEEFEKGDVIFNFMENDSVNIAIGIVIENTSKLPFKNDTFLHYGFDSLEIIIGDKEFEYLLADSLLKLFDNLAADGILLELEK